MTKIKSFAVAVAVAALMAGSAVSTASAQNHQGETPARTFLRHKAMRPMMHHRHHHSRMMKHRMMRPRTM